MAGQTTPTNQLPQATLPVSPNDSVTVSQDGTTLSQTTVKHLAEATRVAIQQNGTPITTTTDISTLNVTGTAASLSAVNGVLTMQIASSATGSGGTVTTTGTPASGNMAKFSGSSSITNAVAGTDYAAPTNGSSGQALTSNGSGGFGTPVTLAASATTDTTSASNITSGTLPNARLTAVPNSALANSSVTVAGNSVSLGGSVTQDQITGLSTTGLIKRTAANSLAIATSGTDYAPATSGTSILKGNGSGGFSAATSGTDYAPATSGASILKGNGAGGFSSATSGTDYCPATSGSALLKGNGSGGTSSATAGTDYPGLATQNTYSKSQTVTPTRNTGATGTVTPDFSGSNVFIYTLTGDLTIANGTNPTDGQVITFTFKQDGTGSRALTLGSKYKVAGGAPTLSTAAGARDVLSFVYDATDDVYVGSFGKGATVSDTWDGTAMSSNIGLGNGNRSARATGSHGTFVRGSIGKSTGKPYWEVVVDAIGVAAGESLGVGIATSAHATTSNISGTNTSDAVGWWGPSGNTYSAGSSTPVIANGYAAGDVLMFSFDIAAGKLYLGKNGTWLNGSDPAAGTGAHITALAPATWYIAASPWDTNGQCTLRTQASQLGYSVPSGFAAGWY